MAPVGLLAILLSPWVGRRVGRLDPRHFVTLAFLGFAFVLWMRSRFTTEVPLEVILLPIFLQGAALAFFFIPLQTITLSGLTPEELPAAAGLSNFLRITAGAVGTSLFTTLWEQRATLHHARLAEALQAGHLPATQVLDQLAGAGLTPEQALGTVARLLDRQAYTLGMTDLYLLSSALYAALIFAVWFARPLQVAAPARPAPGAATNQRTV
jgi:DHA2 family multidrug resistance protein